MKKPTLGGVVWAYNHLSLDYCLPQCVAGLQELCDQVIVLDAGSTDGSSEAILQMASANVTPVNLGRDEWHKHKGREKIAYFQNLALAFLSTDYYIVCQADEVLHQDSFPKIREALASGAESFMVTRFNLWGSPYKYLNVPLDRQPCSPQVIRISKCDYLSVDDGENIGAAGVCFDYVNDIRIYHMGFVRDCRVMKDKIIHMQTGVFEMADYDEKLKTQTIFDWRAWFSEEDLTPIPEELPIFVQTWAKERDTINSKYQPK
jgi:glycosyltransferase involved in cell wall biosynthesis